MESLTFYRLLIYRVNNKHIKITNILTIFQDIVDYTGDKGLEFPIIADPKRELAVKFGMLDPVEKDGAGLPLTCRAVSMEFLKNDR